MALNGTHPAPALPPPGVEYVASFGLAVATFVTSISILGLLWHIGLAAIGAAAVIFAIVIAQVRSCAPKPKHGLIPWPWMLTAGLLLLIPAALCFSPPFTWDEVAYSVALPRDYARTGYFFYNADYGPYSAFPSNFEAMVTVAIRLLHGPTAAKLLNIIFIFGLFIICADLARLLGARKPWLAVGALLFITSDVVLDFSFVAKGDIFAAFFESLSVSMAMYYLYSLIARYIILAGLFLGAAIGSKYSCVQFAACVVPLLAYFCLLSPLTPSTKLKHIAWFCITSAVIASPWYLRNVWLFRDPLFPFFTSLFSPSSLAFKSVHAAITDEMFNGLSGFSLKTSTPTVFVRALFSGFGGTATIFGFVGLLLSAFTCKSNHIRFLLSVTTAYTLVTLAFGFWEPRYFLFLLVGYCAFATYAICRFLPVHLIHARQLKLADNCAAILVAAAFSIGALSKEWSAYGAILKETMHGEELGAFGGKHVAYFQVATWINKNLTSDDKIGIGINVQPFFYIEKRYFHIHPMSEKGNLQELRSDEEFLMAFKSLGLTMLAFRRWQSEPSYTPDRTPKMHEFITRFYSAVESLERKGKLIPIEQVNDVRIYRIAYDE